MASQQDNESNVTRKRISQVTVTRPVYTESDFQKENEYLDNDVTFLEKLKKKKDKIKVTPLGVWQVVCRVLPILKWIPNYKLKTDIVGDTISGITTAIMRVPQEMAYALLATLPAVCGLYVAFFAVLTYAILGTSRHISIGTWAVVSIMTGDAIDSVIKAEEAADNPGTEADFDDATQKRIEVAISLCLLVGIIQAGLGILRLGIVTIYLSEPLVNGFTTGAAVHVLTSQAPKLFGISVTRYSGPFALVYTYIEFFSELATANTCAIITSIVSLLILVFFGELNDRQAAKGWCRKDGQKGKKLPLPAELLVVVAATLASDFGRFEEKYNLDVVGDIPTGLPLPIIPSVKYFGPLIGTAIAIAIVGFAISISMAQLFAARYNYEVDANQEFIALGGSNIVGSFFQCFPVATSMSRSAVQEGAGGKTQLASIFSALVVLVILLWLGPLLTQLPQCVLACIIAIALRGMLRQVKDLRMLWKVSMYDFLMWLVTFTLVVLLGVDLGLLLGVIFSLVTIVVRSQSPYCTIMGRVPNTDIYRDTAVVQSVEELPGIKIFRCSSSLSFLNADHFKNSLYKKAGVNPQKILIAREENKGKKDDKETSISFESTPNQLKTVIIECSMFTYLDLVGVKTLQTIATDYAKLDVQVIFANCKSAVLEALQKSSTINSKQAIGLDKMYISLHDAVMSRMEGARQRAGTVLERLEMKETRLNIQDNIISNGTHAVHMDDIQNDKSDGLSQTKDGISNGNINMSYEPDTNEDSNHETETDDTPL